MVGVRWKGEGGGAMQFMLLRSAIFMPMIVTVALFHAVYTSQAIWIAPLFAVHILLVSPARSAKVPFPLPIRKAHACL